MIPENVQTAEQILHPELTNDTNMFRYIRHFISDGSLSNTL